MGLRLNLPPRDHSTRPERRHPGIENLAARGFRELSGGQRQLAIFARALVAQAEVLVLDEPTSALDLKNQALIMDWMARLPKIDGMTVVFTTHHPNHALAVADEVLPMVGPGEYVHGSAEAVLTEWNLQAVYGVAMRKLRFQHEGRDVDALVPVLRARSLNHER